MWAAQVQAERAACRAAAEAAGVWAPVDFRALLEPVAPLVGWVRVEAAEAVAQVGQQARLAQVARRAVAGRAETAGRRGRLERRDNLADPGRLANKARQEVAERLVEPEAAVLLGRRERKECLEPAAPAEMVALLAGKG